MNLAFKSTEHFADSLRERLDHSLATTEFIENCLHNTRQLHHETDNTSILLFYAMVALGRVTKGSPAVQKFTELYKDHGNVDCAQIVSTGSYREQDLAFYWSTSRDLSHLFEPSTVSAFQTFNTCEEVRHLSETIMSEEWSDIAFFEVDKIPTDINPRDWGLYNLKDATIAYDTAEFAVLDHLGKPVLSLCSANYQHVYFTSMFRDHFFEEHLSDNDKQPAVELEDALMIQDLIRQPNFCHWLLDQLPRLRHLEDSQRIIMYKLAPFMKNMLELMGIGSQRVHELGERAVLRVRNLTIESSMAKDFYHPCQHANSELIDYIESSLSTTKDEAKTKAVKRKVYLSRNKYEGRRISNEGDLLKGLKKLGFHTVYPEELSVQEQISLFKNADIIVSPHGASLANIIFCEKVTLIEIFNQNYGTPTFYMIAKLLGFQYQHILGTNPLLSDVDKQTVGLSNLQYEDMEVDLSRLNECLEKIIPDYAAIMNRGVIHTALSTLIRRAKFIFQ